MGGIAWGDRGLVRVNEKTRIIVASLAKKGDDPDMDMKSGGIMVMLTKLVRGESFQVKTATQVASVSTRSSLSESLHPAVPRKTAAARMHRNS